MIEQYLVSELDTIPELTGKNYPVAAPVGETEPPFCLYTRISSEIQRDLYGEPVFFRDVFQLDLFWDDMDALCQLEQDVIQRLKNECVDVGDGLYIFSVTAAPGADGFDMNMEIHRRSVACTLTYWRWVNGQKYDHPYGR